MGDTVGRTVPPAQRHCPNESDASAAFDHKGLHYVVNGVHLPCYSLHCKFG